MRRAFYFYYKSRPGRAPEPDMPVRQLELRHNEGRGWRVLVFGGGKNLISEEPVASLEAGEIFLNRIARELQNSGWREYVKK